MASFLDVLDEVMEDPNVQKNIKALQASLGQMEKGMATDPKVAGAIGVHIGGAKKGIEGLLQNLSGLDVQYQEKKKQKELEAQKKLQTSATDAVAAKQTGVGSVSPLSTKPVLAIDKINNPKSPIKPMINLKDKLKRKY